MVKISKEAIELAQSLYSEGMSYGAIVSKIYTELGEFVHIDTVRHHCKRKFLPKLTTVEKLKSEKIEKVLVLSDVHIPFERKDIIEVVEKHKDEITTIILGGDIVDCHSISTFGALDPLALNEEMVRTHNLLKQIDIVVPNAKKILIKGNHEQRYAKYMEKNANELNKLHSDNVQIEIVKGFEVHDRINGVVHKYEALDNYEVVDDWFVQLHDMIVCHPLSFSRIGARTAQMALEYFVERCVDFSTVLVAHTHKVASCFKFSKYSVEIGCMCLPQGYAQSGKLTYTQQQCGYHVATFKNGKYSVNLSKQYVLDYD